MRRLTRLLCSAVLLVSLMFVSIVNAQDPSDSAAMFLRQGAAEYDSVLIKRALAGAGNERTGKRYLFDATCLYRLQTVAYLAGNKKEIARYGVQALAFCDTAKILGADPYSVYVVRTYVSQLMAGLGITYGAKYGPLIGSNFKAMKALNPNGYDTRFVACVNLLEMPSFIGGNPKKALPLLDALYREYPESTAVGISLARGLVKEGRKAEAIAVLEGILVENPKCAMARREREGLRWRGGVNAKISVFKLELDSPRIDAELCLINFFCFYFRSFFKKSSGKIAPSRLAY